MLGFDIELLKIEESVASLKIDDQRRKNTIVQRDFIALGFAFLCVVFAENFAMTRTFGIPAYAVRFGGRPGIWISRFLVSLVALPILTLWLWKTARFGTI